MKIEVHGQDAVQAAEELLSIEEFKDSNYEIVKEVEQEGTLATIATLVGIWGGSLTIAEKLYQWNQKYQKSLPRLVGAKIEKILIVTPHSNRVLLKDATVEQIQEILED